MAHVTRLRTYVEVDGPVADPSQMAVSARLEAVLGGGEQVLLLADRGWGSSGPPDLWERTSVEDITDTARMVVGPDEPFDGHTQEDMEADHWNHLALILRAQGVTVDGSTLQRLPHDVVLGEQLLVRIGVQPDDGITD